MTMPPTSKLSIRGPINRVSYDVLREIFVHCLPQDPLNNQQPDTTIAPMLLCHICSSWRTVALTSATLWSHLFYCLTIRPTISDDSKTWKILEHEMEFLMWWKRNQGSMPPFLSFVIKSPYLSMRYQDVRLAEDEITFLLEYLESAQYLDLDIFYWRQLQQWVKRGYHAAFLNLHSLMKSGGLNDSQFYCFESFQCFVSNRTPSVLRRLSIENEIVLEKSKFTLIYWPILTHIALNNVEMSLDVWHSLIHAVPNLQWGHFDIDVLFDTDDHMPPSTHTLSKLSSLSLIVRDIDDDFEQFQFSLLFTNLHLPALEDLSLFTPDASVSELYTVLESAPAVTRMALGADFLRLEETEYDTKSFAARGMVPIWRRATQLVHIQFKFPAGGNEIWHVEVELGLLIEAAFFSDNGWLDLKNPAYPSREITLIVETLESDHPVYDEAELNLMSSNIREDAEIAPNVVVQITSESESEFREEEKNKWCSRI